MDERDFVLLDILGRTGNITRAADELYLSQSAMSKRVQAIEQELGVKLLLRSRQGVRFTPEGELVLKTSHRMVKELEEMRQTLKSAGGQVCGTLNAGVSINYALYCLPQILVDFRRSFPLVETRITTGKSQRLLQELQNGNLDAAVVRGEFSWEGKQILLYQEKIFVIRAKEQADVPLSVLPYVNRKTDPEYSRMLMRWMRENNLRPEQNGIFVDNINTCLEMVARGLGWGIVPEICLGNFDGDAQPVCFADGEPFLRSTYLMYSEAAEELPQVQAFIGIMKEKAVQAFAHRSSFGTNGAD